MLVVSGVIDVGCRMPWIDGRSTKGGGIVGAEFGRDGIDEGTGTVQRSDGDFLDSVSNAIANIVRSMLITGIRRFCHQHTQELCCDRLRSQMQSNCAALTVLECSGRKRFPFPLRTVIEIECVLTNPIFNLKSRRVRVSPRDAHGIHWLGVAQINDYPLRMQGIAFARKFAREVGIALPISESGARYGTIAASRKPAMRKRICQDVTKRLLQFRTARKIAALVDRVAPRSVLRPMPGCHAQFRVIAIGDRTQPAERASWTMCGE